MADTQVSVISSYSSVSDIEIIKRYKKTRDPMCASIMLFRYEPAMLSAITKWHSRYKRITPVTDYDQSDIMQTAYQAALECLLAIKDPDRLKSAGSRIMSAVRDTLEKTYGHRKYETSVDIIEHLIQDTHEPEPQESININMIKKKLPEKLVPLFNCIYVRGCTQKEIAAELYPDKNGSVRMHIWRQHQKLLTAVRRIYLKTDRQIVCLNTK